MEETKTLCPKESPSQTEAEIQKTSQLVKKWRQKYVKNKNRLYNPDCEVYVPKVAFSISFLFENREIDISEVMRYVKVASPERKRIEALQKTESKYRKPKTVWDYITTHIRNYAIKQDEDFNPTAIMSRDLYQLFTVISRILDYEVGIRNCKLLARVVYFSAAYLGISPEEIKQRYNEYRNS